jgi:GDPmannose 4,6-dehydratase
MNVPSNEKPRHAVILGAAGQDGRYLQRHLISAGYRVTAIGRQGILTGDIQAPFDVLDSGAVGDLIGAERPDELYYLAAHHHSSHEQQGTLRELLDTSYAIHCRGLMNVLDAIAAVSSETRLFYAASSLVFGDPTVTPQNEDTPMAPICAYGVTKALGIELCRLYRKERGIFCSTGILYNHESPVRGIRFVTRKIARAAAGIRRGEQSALTLGDLDARVDWSFAGDVVRAMHAMLQLDTPRDFVVASGTLRTVREFAARAFADVGLDYQKYVVESPAIIQRSRRRVPLHGDPSRLAAATGWKAQTSFEELVDMMVRAELPHD